jgi:L-fucose isomerase-like protein
MKPEIINSKMIQSRRTLISRVAVASVSSPLEVGADRAAQAAEDAETLLKQAGCGVVLLGEVNNSERSRLAGRKAAEEHIDALVIVTASWFEDYLVLDLLEECNVPILLWSLPGMETGALCGSQQLTMYLKYLEVPFKCVYGPLENGDNLTRAMKFLRAVALRSRLRRTRIGLLGNHVRGMTDAAVNELALKKDIGPRIVNLDLPQLLARMNEFPKEKALSIWRSVCEKSNRCLVSEEAGIDSIQMYLTIREAVDSYQLDAIAVGCYPHLMGRVCLAASLLADEGVPLACEGDVNGAVGQLILSLLTDEPTHNTDWLEPLEDGTIVLTHCGSGSFSLAEKKEDITLASVRLMGQGVCGLFPAKPGPVTMINLVPGCQGYQCAVLEGEAISTTMVFPGNPVRIKFKESTDKLIEWIHEKGIGHHWMIGYGHIAEEMIDWSKIINSSVALLCYDSVSFSRAKY